jgi:hypothetical protein
MANKVDLGSSNFFYTKNYFLFSYGQKWVFLKTYQKYVAKMEHPNL